MASDVVLLGERSEIKPRPRKESRGIGLGRFALVTITFFTFAFLYVPIAVLIAFSFNSARTGATWQSFSLQWYERVFSNTRIPEAAANSLIVAALATVGSVVIGTLMAIAMERYQFRAKLAWDALLYLPVIIPEIVMGISLLIFFAAINLSRGIVTLVISHIAFCMPFVYSLCARGWRTSTGRWRKQPRTWVRMNGRPFGGSRCRC